MEYAVIDCIIYRHFYERVKEKRVTWQKLTYEKKLFTGEILVCHLLKPLLPNFLLRGEISKELTVGCTKHDLSLLRSLKILDK